jgi:hypothetical protein
MDEFISYKVDDNEWCVVQLGTQARFRLASFYGADARTLANDYANWRCDKLRRQACDKCGINPRAKNLVICEACERDRKMKTKPMIAKPA